MVNAAPGKAHPDRRHSADGGVSLEQLHQQLADAIATIETGEQWQAWLDFARRLPRYSFNNVMLIRCQRPDATSVASYKTWQAMDRQVRRGEKALRVLAPIVRRVPVVDEGGRPLLDADGRRQYRQRVTGSRPVPVFDVAQTDGPPLPEAPRPALLEGRSPAGLWPALVGEVSERGYRLLRGPAGQHGGANGVTKVAEREVWVRDDITEAQAAKTLAHELAHILLLADSEQLVGCAGIREVEAESVAHLVMATHGVTTGSFSYPYVATWAHPLAAVEHVPITEIVGRTGTRVMRAAAEIIEVTSAALEKEPGPATEALAARVHAATERSHELHERAAASLLPAIERAVLLGVIADSHKFFRRQVPHSWVPDYLAQRRLSAALTSPGLGYAPKSWTALTDHLRSLGYADDHIEASGMAMRARPGTLIDRFRDRLTIPLHDPSGDLVGFTARAAPTAGDRDGPKYLNSPTSSIFRKGDLLYGLDRFAASTDGRSAVVCEGPLDAIAVELVASQHGLALAGLASVGTAFTDQQARHVLAAADGRPVYLAYDGDDAGQRATEAVWRHLTNAGPYDVRAAQLPDGTDPAWLAVTEPATLAGHLEQARPAALAIAIGHIERAHLDGHAGRELLAFRSLCQLATRMPQDQRPPYLLELAQRLNLDPTEAATIAVEQNPKILSERLAVRAAQLDRALHACPSDVARDLDSRFAQEQPARIALNG